MWTTLTLMVTALAPQDARVADAIRAAHAEQQLTAAVDAVQARLAAVERVAIRSVDAPEYVTQLRGSGVGVLDLVRADLTFAGPDSWAPDAMLELVARLADKSVPKVKSKPIDPREFERLCEHLHRDVVKAIGSGRDIETTSARLHAVLDKVRVVGMHEPWDKATRDLVAERFERVGRAERDKLVVLARRLLAASMRWSDAKLLRQLVKKEAGPPRSIEGVRGDVLYDRETTFGRMVVGGPGPNEYECSQVDVIVDLGGDDIYRGPAGGAGEMRQLAVTIDLAGNDRYEAINDGLGSATFGIGLCLDFEGDDVYRGGDRCLGFGAAGVGMMIDLAGKDDYEIGTLGGGAALAGLGICMDVDGSDKFVAAAEAFGCALPGGVGFYFDAAGDDERTLGGHPNEIFGESITTSFGFGAGLGIHGQLPGGVGVCVDLAGNDRWIARGLACGVGLDGGCGIIRDGGGDDVYEVGRGSLGVAIGPAVGVASDAAGDDKFSVLG
ncbi:MAG: hypothetical protein KDB80_17995, partial [Planctomycetes bacterium]|nr:hypothetical protein [Planctomycetota bacterium]